jgi:hypothetical protein
LFRQGELIRDYVFPLVTVEVVKAGELAFRRFLGTGFLIGGRGLGLMAHHVLAKTDDAEAVAALFVDAESHWRPHRVQRWEGHPTEDVALLELESGPWQSFLQLSGEWEGQSSKYQMFGSMLYMRLSSWTESSLDQCWSPPRVTSGEDSRTSRFP